MADTETVYVGPIDYMNWAGRNQLVEVRIEEEEGVPILGIYGHDSGDELGTLFLTDDTTLKIIEALQKI